MLCLQIDSPCHPPLFVNRHDEAQGAMLLGILQDVNPLCHTDAIVCSQAGAVCPEVFLLPYQLDGIPLRVVVTPLLCHTHHIHMALNDSERSFFEPRRGRRLCDDIVHLILLYRKTCLCEVLLQEITHSLFVA